MSGILTKTVIRSPVVKWILQARIRHRRFNDVVFVGDDFVHIKQVRNNSHLEHVASKTDFSGRIRAAKTFTVESIAEDEDILMKTEHDLDSFEDERSPLQCLVLTVDTNELLFLHLVDDSAGGYHFIHQPCPLPAFDRMLFQPGEHLAVESQSRALAVAANEREVVIYSTKSKQDITHALNTAQQGWCPISAQRPLQVDGVIQHVDFLIPPNDEEDRIVLLIITAEQRKTRAIWVDWYIDRGLEHAQIHPGQALDVAKSLPGLLIPLRDASFFLVSGSEVRRWTNILCGSATGSDIRLLNVKPLSVDNTSSEPMNPGSSARKPMWTNWCRPKRVTQDHMDHLYLIREDGVVYLLQAATNEVLSSHAGHFHCHVGSAFASIGDFTRDPDILIAAGDMSNGQIVSIGHWATPIRVADLNRSDTMAMNLIETIPNWASVTDMVTSRLPGKIQRPRDGVFVTSGRQPYGAITELRQGLEARLSVYFDVEGLQTVTDLWALPLAGLGHVLFILSSPLGSRFIQVSLDADAQAIDEVDSSTLALDGQSATLAAGVLGDGRLVQISRSSIRISPGTLANFEDIARIDPENNASILAGAIYSTQSIALTAERSGGSTPSYQLAFRSLQTDDSDSMDTAFARLNATIGLEDEPLCLAFLTHQAAMTTLVASASGYLRAYTNDHDGNVALVDQMRPSASSDGPGLCDSIAILRHWTEEGEYSEARYLVVCGLRDGRLYLIHTDLQYGFRFAEESMIDFSQSAVKLTQPPDDQSIAYAISGLEICLLSWNSQSSKSLNVQNIWVADKERPELAQGAVVACTHMPPAHLLSFPELANSLVLISGDEFLLTTLPRQPAAVPRQIPVSGTPNRLIYAEQQRCFVSASIQYGVQHFPSSVPQSKPEERRQVWPVIDFIPSRGSEPSFSYEMQPGERVYALLEWSFKLSEDKIYSFILVGGSYKKSSGSMRGRITFIQPVNKSWAVVDVKEGRTQNFDSPVYGLALLDDVTYVACVGRSVIVSRFSIDERKWEQICSPFKLASPGIFVTVFQKWICVSTAEDGFVRLELDRSQNRPDNDRRYDFVLRASSTAPRADTLLSHVVIDQDEGIPLLTTKYGQIIGLSLQSTSENEPSTEQERDPHANLYLDTQLPRSLTRLKNCDVRPLWKPAPPKDIADTLLGCAADGTLMGIAHLHSTHHMQQLFWLQRLCEWSEKISPHSCRSPPYSASERSSARKERAVPIGLNTRIDRLDKMIVLKTNRSHLNDGHIDGDVLARLLERGGADILRSMIRESATWNDRVGEWTRRHLDEELEVVDEVIQVLEQLLDCWL